MNEKIAKLLSPRVVLPVATGLLGFGLGVGSTFLFTKKKREDLTDQIQEMQQKQLELDFERAEKDAEFNKAIGQAAHVVKDLKESGLEMLKSLQGITPVESNGAVITTDRHPSIVVDNEPAIRLVRPDENVEVPIEPDSNDESGTHNIFDSAGDEWDYGYELNDRRGKIVYVLHEDEFAADENDWDSQSTLTWYEKDQILCDSNDVPIYNPESIIGELRFGHGTADPNVFYVRNHRLKAEYEVIRDPGSYEVEVLGEQAAERGRQADLKHSQSPRKFRDD